MLGALVSLTLLCLPNLGSAVELGFRSLESYPGAICNDGSVASYYVEQGDYTAGQTIMVYLEGGGACTNANDCTDRCTGEEAQWLCQAHTEPDYSNDDTIWSSDESINPGLHDSFKVYVPYCTSDGYSGRRDASDETGGWAFHGKIVTEAVITDLLDQVVGSKSLGQFVLTGISAGAFGAAFNCDKVADMVKAKDSNVDMRCIFDGLDFIPTEVSDESCDPFEWGSAAKAFWQGEFDKSCEEANAEDDAMCNVFSTYYLDVETPWMIVAPLEEIEPTVHPCAPEYPENPDFWAQWRQQLYGISLELSQELPENGMFISNCPHHVSMLDPTIWGELEVPALDSDSTTTLTYKQAVANWLKGTHPFQGLDDPSEQMNPKCPWD